MFKIFSVFVILQSLSAFATVTVGAPDCPSQFEGKVKSIIAPEGATTAFTKQRVIFENLATIKGDVKDQVQLDILKNGPFEIENGEDYRVQMRDGKLCWIEKVYPDAF